MRRKLFFIIALFLILLLVSGCEESRPNVIILQTNSGGGSLSVGSSGTGTEFVEAPMCSSNSCGEFINGGLQG